MPLYTYNGVLLLGSGGLAATDGLCCGACCKDGECTNKDKCACEEYGGEWHAGKSCSDTDFHCSSSSSDSSKSSSSRSSYSSYSSYSSDYGACCVAVQGPPTYSSSCSRVVSGSEGDSYEECVEVQVPGAITYTCTTGTAFECYYIGGVFYPGKTCGQIRCGSGSSGSSGSGDSNSSSSSSDKTKPSRTSGWVCKPVWVCEPKKECETAADCPCSTVDGWSDADEDNCCPPGSTWNEKEAGCETPDGGIIAGGGTPKSEIVKCCDGKCCPAEPGCCGDKCLPADKECCDGEIRDPEAGGTGCCTEPNGDKNPTTRAQCDDLGGDWSACDCPCPDNECEWVYNRGDGAWSLSDPDGIDARAGCATAGCDCPEPDFTPGEGAPLISYTICAKQAAAQQLRTIKPPLTAIYICDN